MLASKAFAFLSLASLSLAQNHVSGKNTAFSGLSFNEDGLYNALTPVSSSYTKWAWGTLPNFCYKSAIPTSGLSSLIHCNPYDVEVYDVKYADCSVPWTVCRCNNATWTIDDMVDIIGRIPVKARQYTRSFAQYGSISGAEATTWAYSLGVDTAIFDGPAKGGHRPTLMLHENAHTIDYGWNQIHGSSGWVSGTTGFVNAINTDTCVPDSYAKSNDIEDFAQVTVCGSYDKNVGPLSKYGSVDCMKNQLAYVENTITETLTPGGSCSFVWAKDSTVCMGPAAGCGAQGSTIATRSLSSAKFAKKDVGIVPTNTPKLMVDELEQLLPGSEGQPGFAIRRRKDLGGA